MAIEISSRTLAMYLTSAGKLLPPPEAPIITAEPMSTSSIRITLISGPRVVSVRLFSVSGTDRIELTADMGSTYDCTGLNSDTAHQYQPVAVNPAGEVVGDVVSVSTLANEEPNPVEPDPPSAELPDVDSSTGTITATGTSGRGETLTLATTGSFGSKQGQEAKLFEYGGEQYFNGAPDAYYASRADQEVLQDAVGPWERVSGGFMWDKTLANQRKPTIAGCYHGFTEYKSFIGRHSALGGADPLRLVGYEKKYYFRAWLRNSSPIWGKTLHYGYTSLSSTPFNLHPDAPFWLDEKIIIIREGVSNRGVAWIKGFGTDPNGAPFVEFNLPYFNGIDENGEIIDPYNLGGSVSFEPKDGDLIEGAESGATLTIDQPIRH